MMARLEWFYWVAIAAVVAALAVMFVPREQGDATLAAPVRRATSAVVLRLGDTQSAELGALAERVVFRSAEAVQQEAALDVPPRVVGLVRVGRRGFAYLEGDRPERLAVGQSTGGWTLTAVGPNYAEFGRAGQVTRVRLFTAQKGGAQPQTSADPTTVPTGGPRSSEPST